MYTVLTLHPNADFIDKLITKCVQYHLLALLGHDTAMFPRLLSKGSFYMPGKLMHASAACLCACQNIACFRLLAFKVLMATIGCTETLVVFAKCERVRVRCVY